MDSKQYQHLENICNIQQRFINGEIKKKEFLKKIDEENQRHLLWLIEENKKIKPKILIQNNYQKIKQELEKTKVYKIFDIGERL